MEYNYIYNIISQVSNVDGRMDTIEYKGNLIIIDYAHTPDAVEKVINSVSNLGNRVITIMGNIATQLSNQVIFTSDNPRDEDPLKIIDDIVKELDTFNYEIEANRQKAIKKGIQMLEKGDILLILGKGHEDYQIISNKRYHFSDKEEVLKVIGR